MWHRCKGHRADIRRRSEAKHCSSLCSQSEGANIVTTKHGLKIQQSYASERWPCSLRVRGPHFASKVSYSASPHANTDCQRTREQTQPSLGAETNASGSRHERIWEQRRTRLGAETNESGTVFAKRHRGWSESHVFPLVSTFSSRY